MKRPSRNIEIFSMSALDIFASALGAFIVIALILFPYFLKNYDVVNVLEETRQQLQQSEQENQQIAASLEQAQSQLETAQSDNRRINDELAQAESQLAQAQNQLQAAQSENRQLEQQLAQTFVVVVMKWGKRNDIDLHVIDPEGRKFNFSKNNRGRSDYPDTGAELSIDNTKGPGIEIWEHPQAISGQYQVGYHYYSGANSGETLVQGSVYHRDGMIKLRDVTLPGVDSFIHVANVIVRENGIVRIQ